MKYKFVIILFLLCLLVGCMNNGTSEDDGISSQETDFENGQVQREMVYYNDTLWGLDFYNSELNRLEVLPDGYTLAGEITDEDSYEIPSKDFHSAHIAVGVGIYANPDSMDAIYLAGYWSDGTFARFVPIQ